MKVDFCQCNPFEFTLIHHYLNEINLYCTPKNARTPIFNTSEATHGYHITDPFFIHDVHSFFELMGRITEDTPPYFRNALLESLQGFRMDLRVRVNLVKTPTNLKNVQALINGICKIRSQWIKNQSGIVTNYDWRTNNNIQETSLLRKPISLRKKYPVVIDSISDFQDSCSNLFTSLSRSRHMSSLSNDDVRKYAQMLLEVLTTDKRFQDVWVGITKVYKF